MLRGVKAGALDHILTFYAPSKAKDAIGDTVNTPASQGATRAERIWKKSDEAFEGQQQVGSTTEDFRIRGRRFAITHEWEFDAFQISEPSVVKRYKVRGIKKEGRGNSVIVTGEVKNE